RERDSNGGWTPDLAARALAALRVAATYALGRRVGYAKLAQSAISNQQSAISDGTLVLRNGLFRSKPIAVSGAITPPTVARELTRNGGSNATRSAMLESLAQALSTLTTAGYARDGKPNDNALDEALSTAVLVLKRVRFEQTWIMKRLVLRRGGAPAPVGSRVWSR